MFSEYEKRVIVMALMYLKSDYTPEDLSDLEPARVAGINGRDNRPFEDMLETLIYDFAPAPSLHPPNQRQLKLFRPSGA